MRIVLLSGLDERTPPVNYGSVETLVHCSALELVKLGHEVIVFATKDSANAFKFCEFHPYPQIRCGIRHMGLSQWECDQLKLQVMRVALQQAIALKPDVLHNNVHTGLIAWSEQLLKPHYMVTTAHWPFDCEVIGPAFRQARSHNVLTISHAQQAHARSMDFDLSFCDVVYNCIAPDRFLPPGIVPRGEHLAWVGRFDRMKGVKEAIAIARLLNRPLTMAGKVDNYAKTYFDGVVKPLLAANRGLVEFYGEVPQLQASHLMALAYAFLMTTLYHESFGLVVAEAFAAGTPVIATDRGAMPELVHDGVNGFVVPIKRNKIDVPGFARAINACGTISSDDCRKSAEKYRPEVMARGQEAVFKSIIEGRQQSRRPIYAIRS
jgi:glycosyltransferase involved in cell wall biosynthesis